MGVKLGRGCEVRPNMGHTKFLRNVRRSMLSSLTSSSKTKFSLENKNGFGELSNETDYVFVQNDNLLTDRWVQTFRRHVLPPLSDAVEKKIRAACNIKTSLIY